MTRKAVFQDDGTGALDANVKANNVDISDSGGYFTGTDVEAALQELGAGGGGGGGITQSYIGYNTVGGTSETIGSTAYKEIWKPVTLVAAGLLTSIDIYCHGDASNVQSSQVAVFTDNAGAPGVCIGSHSAETTASVVVGSNVMTSTDRWLAKPIGIWLPAGNYWIGGVVGNGCTVHYDGSGGDYTATYAFTWIYDPGAGGGVAYTNSSRKYSIRGNLVS